MKKPFRRPGPLALVPVVLALAACSGEGAPIVAPSAPRLDVVAVEPVPDEPSGEYAAGMDHETKKNIISNIR
ncbi:MAG TPA: hypothetical protein VF263_26760 [Longimicrobiaceae bacterium]